MDRAADARVANPVVVVEREADVPLGLVALAAQLVAESGTRVGAHREGGRQLAEPDRRDSLELGLVGERFAPLSQREAGGDAPRERVEIRARVDPLRALDARTRVVHGLAESPEVTGLSRRHRVRVAD